jgi:hypothetical protein
MGKCPSISSAYIHVHVIHDVTEDSTYVGNIPLVYEDHEVLRTETEKSVNRVVSAINISL